MGVIIKDVKRNNNEIIRIEVSEFKGRDLINIRIWYQSIDANGDVTFKPTQKGVTINVAEFHELKDGIDRLGVYLEDSQKGLTPEQPGPIENTPDDDEEKDKDKDEDNDDDEKDEKDEKK